MTSQVTSQVTSLAFIFFALSIGTAPACTPPGEEQENGPDASSFVGDVELEIGTAMDGNQGFLAIEEGSEAILESGAQGGFHLWTTPRFKGISGTVYLDRTARRVENGLLVLRASRMVIEVPENAMSHWWHQEYSLPSFMCPPPIGIQIYDSEIEFRFELRNEEEELLAVDTIQIIARCPEDEAGKYCRRTCSDR